MTTHVSSFPFLSAGLHILTHKYKRLASNGVSNNFDTVVTWCSDDILMNKLFYGS